MQGVNGLGLMNGAFQRIGGAPAAQVGSVSADHQAMQTPSRAVKGFTLIELMIAVVIVGVIAAIALPAYSEFVRKGRRADAFDALTLVQQEQERYRSQNLTFASTLSDLKVPEASRAGHYTLALSEVTGLGYTVTATPKSVSPQNEDSACKSLTVVVYKASLRRSSKDGADADSTSRCWPQ